MEDESVTQELLSSPSVNRSAFIKQHAKDFDSLESRSSSSTTTSSSQPTMATTSTFAVPSGKLNNTSNSNVNPSSNKPQNGFTKYESLPTTTTATTTTSTLTTRITSPSVPTATITVAGSTTARSKNPKPVKVFPGRIRKRIVLKNGGINLCKEHIEKRSRRYLQDTFTTMVDLRWRYNLLVFTLGFVLSWVLFATIWYIVAYFHDDLGDDVPHERCVIGVNSYVTAFLFSFESQHTIGFGNRYPHENCMEGIFFMCFQSIFGVMIECFVVGFVFAKLSRPKKRSQTLIFSRHAVVNQRDGKLCLVFRVGDVRARSYIIGASVSALLISKKISREGEVLPYYHESLKVQFDSCGTSVFLVWPATIYHVIDESSPFYTMDPEALANGKFEIVVMLRGTVESTGQTIEARTSYLPCEIRWGRRFERLIDFRMESGIYRVDYSKFDLTYEVPTPKLSARDLYSQQSQQFIVPWSSNHGDDSSNNNNMVNDC